MSSGAPLAPAAGNWLTALVGRERREPMAPTPGLRPRLPYLFTPVALSEPFDGDGEVSVDLPVPPRVQSEVQIAAPTAPTRLDVVAERLPRQSPASTSAFSFAPLTGLARTPVAEPQAIAAPQPPPNLPETSGDSPSGARPVETPSAPMRSVVAEAAVFCSEAQPAKRAGDPVRAPLRLAPRAAPPLPALTAAPEPVIEISIGRIDIRATAGREQPAPSRRETTAGHDGQLAAYLSRRTRGARS